MLHVVKQRKHNRGDKNQVSFVGVRVPDDVSVIIETAVAGDPEMSRSRVVREAVREWAERRGIEVPA